MTLQDIIFSISNDKNISLEEIKRDYAKQNKLSVLPTNIQLIKTYKNLVKDWKILADEKILDILRKRAIRSSSWIVPIQVLTKPFWCPGKCIFCPTDISMPKSYINTEPGAMRALLNKFDPYKQTYNRLLSLQLAWHKTDKIEMIVLGGTWDVYPKSYKYDFIKWLFDACNHFDEFLEKIDFDEDNPMSARFSIPDELGIKYSENIEQAHEINENSNHRIIGLTVETRPEYITDENCQFWRSLWVTRLEIGLQSLFDEVLDANKRWHSVEQIRQWLHKLRQYGFKFSTHFMSGLYMSDMQKDIESFRLAFEDIYIRPDEIKFYPTGVIPNTELFDLYQKWIYKLQPKEETAEIIRKITIDYIPPYTRIKRLIRDIPANEVIGDEYVTNLRQIVEDKIRKDYQADENLRKNQYEKLAENKTLVENFEQLKFLVQKNSGTHTYILWWDFDISSIRAFVSLCTRNREVRNKKEDTKNELLVVRQYDSSAWKELFISYEDELWYLYGFARLLLIKPEETIDNFEGLWKNVALIRELHVYGQLAQINKKDEEKTQHQWLWTRLMLVAQDIAKYVGYEKMSVISGVWVRGFYEKKLGYRKEGTYVVKDL